MKIMIETERLLLREYSPDDFDAFYKIVSDPETGAGSTGIWKTTPNMALACGQSC